MLPSRIVSATDAKQSFGQLLAQASHGPVGIERHGKVVAVVAPPSLFARAGVLDERHAAREAQKAIELRRLLTHQQVALDLLTWPADRREALLSKARKEVERWERDSLCSPDYVRRWREWLRKSPAVLARLMTSDADGWGPAMRQNSPFLASATGSS